MGFKEHGASGLDGFISVCTCFVSISKTIAPLIVVGVLIACRHHLADHPVQNCEPAAQFK
jgi:hypothetical protein